MAGYDAEGSRVFGITAYEDSDFAFNDESTLSLTVTNQIYFTTDSDGDSEIDNNSSERFGYRLNSGNLESASISTTDGSIPSWNLLIDNVETLSFVYTYSNGTLSSTVGLPNNAAANRHFRDIRSVTVSLRVATTIEGPR
jgi:type II secretory pathway component PulJ